MRNTNFTLYLRNTVPTQKEGQTVYKTETNHLKRVRLYKLHTRQCK